MSMREWFSSIRGPMAALLTGRQVIASQQMNQAPDLGETLFLH